MKRAGLLLMVICVFPMSMFANSYSFEESGGSLNLWQSSKSGAPLQLAGGKITSVQGPGVHLSASSSLHNLGTLKLMDGNLLSETTSGSKQNGSITDTFTYGAGTMSIINTVKNLSIPKGVVFNGTLTSETLTVTYDFTKKENSKGKTIYVADGRTWQLTGNMLGKLYNGKKVSGTFEISKMGKNAGGSATLSGVPEPTTLALLATGLLGVAGLVRRRRA